MNHQVLTATRTRRGLRSLRARGSYSRARPHRCVAGGRARRQQRDPRPAGRSRDRKVRAARLRARAIRRHDAAQGPGCRDRGRARLRRPHRAAATGDRRARAPPRRAGRCPPQRARAQRRAGEPPGRPGRAADVAGPARGIRPRARVHRRRAVGRRVLDGSARVRGPPPGRGADRRGRDCPGRGAHRAPGRRRRAARAHRPLGHRLPGVARRPGRDQRPRRRSPAAGRGGQPARAPRAAGAGRPRARRRRRRTVAGRAAGPPGVP